MAPRQREPSIVEGPEYDNFIAQVQKFHDERGTNFDPAPRVGSHRIDFFRLYKRVTGDGGYDVVSDTKVAWRTIGQDFHLGNQMPTLAFTLKTAYYKNLAAYEIKNFFHKEPPPKEILEDVSAKGGDLLNRTLENYKRPKRYELSNGTDENGTGEDMKLAKEEAMDVDERENAGLRSSRGLREAPPPRQLFQSDVSTTRAPRQPVGQFNSPAPSYSTHTSINGTQGMNGVSQALANYEPKQQVPLALKPVSTPGNNPDAFRADQQRRKDVGKVGLAKTSLPNRAGIPPGFGFAGPSIYTRTTLALKSGIIDEQEFALHHLVKISHERGDKFRFDGFPGMAEALMRKILEVGPLILGIEASRIEQGITLMNKSNGTVTEPHGMLTTKVLGKRKLADRIETGSFSRRLHLINEAGLAFRNLIMLEENAEYVARYAMSRQLLIILLTLPRNPQTVEVQHYGLEIAEQLTRYFLPSSVETLFWSLLRHVESNDRGVILVAIRAICRLGSNVQQSARLQDVPTRIIQRLCDYMLVEDEELRTASLDFIYQFTAVPENVERMLHQVNVDSHIKQLVRLLLYCPRIDAKREVPKVEPKPETPAQREFPIPRIPQDLIEQLLGFDEPERSSQWLRSCFQEDPEGEITQIALWQAYQVPFAPFAAQRPMLPAKDFITNVSTTFTSASAQVMNQPTPRFIIKGIRPRKVPVNPKGQAYMRCVWHLDDSTECGEFAPQAAQMWEHVVDKHLNVTKDSEGKYEVLKPDVRKYSCRWADCKRFKDSDKASAFVVGMHMKTHMPDSSERAFHKKKHNLSHSVKNQAMGESRSWQYQNTQTDERNDASGLPLLSILVLRNLARNIPKTASGLKRQEGEASLVWKLFAPVKEQLYFVMAYNLSLKEYLPSLISVIDFGAR